MGVGREEVVGAEPNEGTSRLVDTYHAASISPLAGVAAIHAYERQVPPGWLGRSEDGLTFWKVHERLDAEHADAERAILAEVGADEPEAAIVATREALEAWSRRTRAPAAAPAPAPHGSPRLPTEVPIMATWA